MTSALRHYALPDNRTKYFTALAAGVIASNPIMMWSLNSGAISSPLMSETLFLSSYTDVSGAFDIYSLFRDLGRQIVVFDDTVAGSPHTAIFRQVMLVSGSNQEGIGLTPVVGQTKNNKPFYLCVWVDITPGGTNRFKLEQVARVG